MQDLSQYQNWFDDDAVTLPPIKSKAFPEGKAYRVESPDFETGALLQQLGSIAGRLSAGVQVPPSEAKRLKLEGEDEFDFAAKVLGPTLDEMKADGVGWGPIRRAVQYCFAYYALSPEQAAKILPKAPPANREERRKQAKKKKPSSTAK